MDTEIVVIAPTIAAGLDPVHELTSSYLRAIGAAEALLRITPEGQVVPELAASFSAIDPTTWEIKLRPDIRFWSGAPVNAAAVQASLERSRTLDKQAEPFLSDLEIVAIDETTLRFISQTPRPLLPLNLAYYQTIIHNAAAYGDQPNPFDLPAADLTGMYRITSFTPKQEMVLEINESYWGTKPSIQRIRYREVTDNQARVLTAQSGEATIIVGIPAEGVATLKTAQDVQLVSVPAANTTTVYLNLRSPFLSDVRVRQALSWAVDRQELVELAREGLSQPASTWLASNPSYPEAAEQGYTRYDLERASTLLDEAGWLRDVDGVRKKDGQPLTFRLLSWGQEKPVAEVLQSQWKKLGVQVDVQHSDDYGSVQAKREAGDWEALLEAWSTFGDPAALLGGQFKPDGKANYGGYDDPTTNQLFEQLEQTSNQAEWRNVVLQINERVSEMTPVIPLHPRPQTTAVSTKLDGFQPHFRQFEYLITADLRLKE